MEHSDLMRDIDDLKERLNKALRQNAGLKQKSKYLEMYYKDAKDRESNSNELVMELLERQRELNVMLNRANIMLNRTQEVMALTSMEFNEMAKALPEPKKEEWSERINKVNELFKKTGIQDAEVTGLDDAKPPSTEDLDPSELKQEAEQAFSRKASIWDVQGKREPPRVEVEPVGDIPPERPQSFEVIEQPVQEDSSEPEDEDSLLFGPRRKSWWHRLAG